MKKLYAFLLVILSISINSSAVSNKRIDQQRNLTIISDFHASNEEFYARTAAPIALTNLILSKKTAIITNADLFKVIVNRNIKENFSFNFNDWDVYQGNDLILLIPHEYKKIIKNNIGFNVSTLKTINSLNDIVEINNPIPFCETNYNDSFNLKFKSASLINFIKQIFNNHKKDTYWNVVLFGHGLPHNQICGITKEKFSEFLEILRNSIKTRIFYYISCFAGGEIHECIYKNKKNFPFLIVCQCLSDCVAFETSARDYAELFKLLSKIDRDDPKTYLDKLEEVCKFATHNYLFPNNIPLFRFAFTDTFIVPNLKNQIISIDKNNASSKLKDLNEHYILLKTPIIKNTIKINNNNNFISAIQGKAIHYIEKIESEDCNFLDIINKFRTLMDVCVEKTFLIKEVKCLNNNKTSKDKFKNVIIVTRDNFFEAFCENKESIYKINDVGFTLKLVINNSLYFNLLKKYKKEIGI